MPAASNRWDEENKPYRQTMADIYQRPYPELSEDIKDQIRYASDLGTKNGFKVVYGLGSPLTSLSWYVVRPVGPYGYDYAPGCQRPEGHQANGFKNLKEAIECFNAL